MTRRECSIDGHSIVLDDGLLDADLERLSKSIEPPPVRYVAAAAHIVLRPSFRALDRPTAEALRGEGLLPHVDFDATLALRRRLASHGFAIAEAMDTAQRYEVGWSVARELIRRTGAANLPYGFIAGAGADSASDSLDLDAAIQSVRDQAVEIQAAGGIPIVLPLLALAKRRAHADEYVAAYRAIVSEIRGPVFLHWLGAMFVPELEGYFPGDSFTRILELEHEKVRGAKLSLLDAAFERKLRKQMLAHGQIVLTGDDFHFAELIAGEPRVTGTTTTTIGSREFPLGEFSHALLGIFDAIAAPAGVALRFLARGEHPRYRERMAPLEELGQVIFEAPTQHYKAGLAFLAWLNGFQDEFVLPVHAESRRDRAHYLRVAALAGSSGVIENADLALDRLKSI